MNYDLAQMREQLLAQQSNNQRRSDSSSNFFPFSKLKAGDAIRIRFVEDGDETNQFFWRKRATRTLKFNGAISNGQFYDGEVYVDVPAFNLKVGEVDNTIPPECQFKSEDDVIQQLIKPLWNGTEEGEATYRKFSRKETFLYQGFVRSEGYETKLYRFLFTSKLNAQVQSCITDEEQIRAFPNVPVDPENGRDFNLKVKLDNGRKDYSSSSWALSTSPLTDAERKFLEENDKFILRDFLPKRPTSEQLEIMAEMFNSICNDEPFNFDKWGTVFKPNNVFKGAEGQVKFRASSNSSDTEIAPKVEMPAMKVEASVSLAPKSITTKEVNEAISANTTTVTAGNVNDMVASLMAQFNQPSN